MHSNPNRHSHIQSTPFSKTKLLMPKQACFYAHIRITWIYYMHACTNIFDNKQMQGKKRNNTEVFLKIQYALNSSHNLLKS